MAIANTPELSPFPSPLDGLVREKFVGFVRSILGLLDGSVGSHRVRRFLALLLVYALLFGGSFLLAYQLRWDFVVSEEFVAQCRQLLLPVVLCKLVLLHSFGQFRSVLSYFGLADFAALCTAMIVVSVLMMALWFVATATAAPPRGVILMDFVLSVGTVTGFRLVLRIARSWSVSGQLRTTLEDRRIAIIGARDVGEALAKDLLSKRWTGRYPVLFLDDDSNRIGRTVHGLPVYGPIESIKTLAHGARVNELVITLTDASPKRMKEIVDLGRQIGASTLIVPSFTQLASGEVKIDRTRPVAIEDLLGRIPVNLDSEEIGRLIRDRVVLVTGAGGSIGSELCRQIVGHEPKLLVMVDQTENVLFEIEQELISNRQGMVLLPMIADVSDESAVVSLLERTRPEIIFHAAAHKHVPLMERQPSEAIKNNTLATAMLARTASAVGVSRFVFISTDKAVNPTSVMGCSKRLSERVIQARQRALGNQTKFLAVRFGNVLGSSGSVIPTFRKQIAQGGPLTVTHPEMTRYFMTIPEAVGLVLQTATLGQGGEIFILDMNEPVKIMDMARQMIELSGYKPGIDIEIKITGLRPGEKLYEELRHTSQTHEPTEHSRIFRLRDGSSSDDVESWLHELRAVASEGDPRRIKAAMQRIVPEYTPFAD